MLAILKWIYEVCVWTVIFIFAVSIIFIGVDFLFALENLLDGLIF